MKRDVTEAEKGEAGDEAEEEEGEEGGAGKEGAKAGAEAGEGGKSLHLHLPLRQVQCQVHSQRQSPRLPLSQSQVHSQRQSKFLHLYLHLHRSPNMRTTPGTVTPGTGLDRGTGAG